MSLLAKNFAVKAKHDYELKIQKGKAKEDDLIL